MSSLEQGDELAVKVRSELVCYATKRMRGLDVDDIVAYIENAAEKAAVAALEELQTGVTPLTELGFS